MRFLRMVVCKSAVHRSQTKRWQNKMFDEKKDKEKRKRNGKARRKKWKEKRTKQHRNGEQFIMSLWRSLIEITLGSPDPDPDPIGSTPRNVAATYTHAHAHKLILHVRIHVCTCFDCASVCAMKYAVCLSNCFHFSLAYLLHRSGFHCILLGMVNMPLCHVTFLANIISYRSRWGNVTYRHPTNTQPAKVWKCGDTVVVLKRREENKNRNKLKNKNDADRCSVPRVQDKRVGVLNELPLCVHIHVYRIRICIAIK